MYILLFLLMLCTQLDGTTRRIAVILQTGWKGEMSVAERMKIACKHLGWKCEILDYETMKEGNYDFAISLIPHAPPLPGCKNYLLVSPPLNRFLDHKKRLKKAYSPFSGYLLCFPPDLSIDNVYPFVDVPSLEFYPSVHQRTYKSVKPTHLFHICSCWGDRVSDKKFQDLYHLLDREPYIRFYGKNTVGPITLQSCYGRIPFEGEALLDRMSEAGVTLILHSIHHNHTRTPSGRIFEAAAASTVIISDLNQFVIEKFGDAVLYIDTSLSAHSILEQIRNHMNWIQSNPNQAVELARRAYQIYSEKFVLEDQLLQLERFHLSR